MVGPLDWIVSEKDDPADNVPIEVASAALANMPEASASAATRPRQLFMTVCIIKRSLKCLIDGNAPCTAARGATHNAHFARAFASHPRAARGRENSYARTVYDVSDAPRSCGQSHL